MPSRTVALAVLAYMLFLQMVALALDDTGQARAEQAKIGFAIQRHDDVMAFCETHRNVDFPNHLFFGSGYKAGAIPRQISSLEDTLQWRCMNGWVLVCSDSADGDWCSKKDVSRKPSPLLRQICREEPNKVSFNFSQEHYSAFDWRCKEGLPVIVQSYALDQRGFFKGPWMPLIVSRGLVIGPKDFTAVQDSAGSRSLAGDEIPH